MKKPVLQMGSPVNVAKKQPSLFFCIIMDLIGYVSFTVPVLGESFDVIWAPLSAFIFWRAFGGAKGIYGGIFNFIEEILPGLDFIPTFTIVWFIEYTRKGKSISSNSVSQ